MEDKKSIKGEVTLILYRNGEKVLEETMKNVVCDEGAEKVANYIHGVESTTPFNVIYIGSYSTPEATTDTEATVHNYVLYRKTATVTKPDATTAQLYARFDAGEGTGNIYDVGVVNSTTAGQLLCHKVRSTPIAKGDADILDVYYRVRY